MSFLSKLLWPFLLLAASTSWAGQGDKSLGGCGLGWVIAPKHSMVSISTRATTNPSTSSFGTTSGTSGCQQHGLVLRGQRDIHLVQVGHAELLTEIAMGQGENIQALGRTLGCQDVGSILLAQRLRERYVQLIDGPESLLNTAHEVIRSDSAMAADCLVLM